MRWQIRRRFGFGRRSADRILCVGCWRGIRRRRAKGGVRRRIGRIRGERGIRRRIGSIRGERGIRRRIGRIRGERGVRRRIGRIRAEHGVRRRIGRARGERRIGSRVGRSLCRGIAGNKCVQIAVRLRDGDAAGGDGHKQDAECDTAWFGGGRHRGTSLSDASGRGAKTRMEVS